MKRITAFLCALALTTGLLPTTLSTARAAGPTTRAVQFYDEAAGRYGAEVSAAQVNITLDGAPLETDMPGVIQTVSGIDGRTLVPVRAIAEPLGADVLWMAETRQVLIFHEKDTIVLTLGSAAAVVNGQPVELPGGVPAGVVKSAGADGVVAERTMVPLRFVSEQLHAQVEWEGDTFTAAVTRAEEPVMPAPEPAPKPEPPKKPDGGLLLRVTPNDNAQTITLYLNKSPNYRVTDLGDRVAVDLLGVSIGSGKDNALTVENPVIPSVRYAQHTDDLDPGYAKTTRVVLDLAPGCTYRDNVTVTGDPNLLAVVVSVRPPQTGPHPTLPPTAELDPAAFTVVLDAGHGGKASGAVYDDIMEKTITLPITLRVGELLRKKGCNVVQTREDDSYVDLYDRAGVANGVGADIFVSIHANASASNRSFQGTFTYHYPKSVKGEELAGAVQKGLVASAGSVDRGLLTNDYVVLRETKMPACLVELGFMSCPEELKRLIQPAYQEKLAQGIANGIVAYLSAQPAKTAAPEPTATPAPSPSPAPTAPVAVPGADPEEPVLPPLF